MTAREWDIEAHPISASKLKTHGGCPKQFDLSYLQGKEPLAQDPYYLDIGNAVHYTIEEVVAGWLHRGGDGLVENREQGDIKTDFLVHFDAVIEGDYQHADPDPRQEFPIVLDEDQREAALGCLDAAAAWMADRQPHIRGVEDEVDFRIQSGDLDVPVTGFMDLTTGRSGDANEVIDWKTGKSEGKSMDEALQGAVYMAGFYHLYGQPPDAIHYVYLKENKVNTLDPDDDLWAILLERVRALLAANEAGEFPAQPSESNCHWCDYELHCDASPVGAGGVDYETYP